MEIANRGDKDLRADNGDSPLGSAVKYDPVSYYEAATQPLRFEVSKKAPHLPPKFLRQRGKAGAHLGRFFYDRL